MAASGRLAALHVLTMLVSAEKPRASHWSDATPSATRVKVTRSVSASYVHEKSKPQVLAEHEPCMQSSVSTTTSAAQKTHFFD